MLNLKTTKRKINKIILHCTATPEGKHVTVESIRRYHVVHRGWKDIGYHFVIYLDGSIHKGRDIDMIGAHTAGYNANSIGICYVGGLSKDGKKSMDTRTDAQKKALRELLVQLRAIYPNATIHGHCEFANKSCPCFSVKEYSDI